MVLKVAMARPKLLKIAEPRPAQKTFRCAVTISCKVSKKAVTRNRLRRLLHDHLRKRLESSSHLVNEWALISLKPSCSDKGATPLLKECDKLLHDAGLIK